MKKSSWSFLRGRHFASCVRLFVVFFLFLSQISCGKSQTSIDDERFIVLDIILENLSVKHFEKKPIDDQFSEALYNDFLDDMDPFKLFFTKEDVDFLSKYRHDLDDQVKQKSFSFLDDVVSIFNKRLGEFSATYPSILSKGFDYSKNEFFEIKPKEYAKDSDSLHDRWRKYLKRFALLNILLQEKKAPGKTLKEYNQLAVKEVLQNQKDNSFYLQQRSPNDYFEIYINDITGLFDPHTTYFSANSWDRFNMQISGQFEGIGAELKQTLEGIKINALIPGGPAFRQGKLEPGDTIIMVKSQGDSKPTNVLTMKVDDAVSLIKGPKGTKVTLTVKKTNGNLEDVTIVREVVREEEVYAKSLIIKSKQAGDIGYINLPRFYSPTSMINKSPRSSDDVKRELSKLKDKKIDKLIFDLRGNGGGSLDDAIDIVGLFIKRGPAVLISSRERSKPEVRYTPNSAPFFRGNVIVLVDELSASASEIFAAAIQDYGRGLIVGSPHTFGKGTVQILIPPEALMDMGRRIYNYNNPIGAIKITQQKFYRINGGSTQLKGVSSDITLPSRYSEIKMGEVDQKHPIGWDSIEPVDYDRVADLSSLTSRLSDLSRERTVASPIFKEIQKLAKNLGDIENRNTVNLNYEQFKKEYNGVPSEDSKGPVEVKPLEVIPVEKAANDVVRQEEKRLSGNIAKDPYVKEATSIFEDWNRIKK